MILISSTAYADQIKLNRTLKINITSNSILLTDNFGHINNITNSPGLYTWQTEDLVNISSFNQSIFPKNLSNEFRLDLSIDCGGTSLTLPQISCNPIFNQAPCPAAVPCDNAPQLKTLEILDKKINPVIPTIDQADVKKDSDMVAYIKDNLFYILVLAFFGIVAYWYFKQKPKNNPPQSENFSFESKRQQRMPTEPPIQQLIKKEIPEYVEPLKQQIPTKPLETKSRESVSEEYKRQLEKESYAEQEFNELEEQRRQILKKQQELNKKEEMGDEDIKRRIFESSESKRFLAGE